jgi:hypothetical protein
MGTLTGSPGGVVTTSAGGPVGTSASTQIIPAVAVTPLTYAGGTTTSASTPVVIVAGSPPASTALLSSDARFVTNLYVDLLRRWPGSAEISGWTGALAAGKTRQDLVHGIEDSVEYRGDLITQYYESFLLRAPDPSGMANWQARMGAGMSPEQLAASLVSSPEYYQLHGGTFDGWLNGVYQDFLGRSPDVAGSAGWTASWQKGTLLYNIALGVSASLEAYSLQVTGSYHMLLGRDPDAGGLQSWVGSMAKGMSLEELHSRLALSDEFANEQPGTAPLVIQPPQQVPLTTNVISSNAISTNSASNSNANNGTSTSSLQLTLQAPDFTTSMSPFVTVTATGALPFGTVVHIDVDLKHDGSFADAGDQDQTTTFLQGSMTSFSLNKLPIRGSYDLLARVKDASGNDVVSSTVTTVVDPYAGVIGAQDLIKLYNDYMQAIGMAAAGSPSTGAPGGAATGSSSTGGTGSQTTDPTGGSGGQSGANPTSGGTTGGSTGSVPSSGSGQTGSSPTDTSGGSTQSNPTGTPPDQFFKDRYWFTFDAQHRVEVDVHATLAKYLNSVEDNLKQLGMDVLSDVPSQAMVQGFLPVTKIMMLTSISHFYGVDAVYAAQYSAGSAISQGDHLIKADQFRVNQVVNGQGITVGIISNSINQAIDANGQIGIAASQARGDLPPQGVNVLEDGLPGSNDEGRAMAEVVYDTAPGAALAFHTAQFGPQDMAAGIQQLTQLGANVIVDDANAVSLGEPWFNDGIVAQAVDNAVNQGVFYVSAAGNLADHGYMKPWKSVIGTVGGITGTFFDFGTGEARQPFTLDPFQAVDIYFQWDNPWLEGGANPNGNFLVNTEIDAIITDSNGNLVADFNNMSMNTNEAMQHITFANFSRRFGPDNFALSFFYNPVSVGPVPTIVRWIALDNPLTEIVNPRAEGEGAPTIAGHNAAAEAETVGAVSWFDPTRPEGTSSLGGNLPIVFDTAGNRLNPVGIRFKPEIAGPDAVSNSFFGTGRLPGDPDPDSNPRFSGTSAAAATVAGAVALLKEQIPGADVPQLKLHIQETAAPAGSVAKVGAGLIQLVPVPPNPTNLPDDVFEPNDTSDTATDFGALTQSILDFPDLTINIHANGLPDYDWYKWNVAQDGTFTANITFQSLALPAGGDLELRVYNLDPTNNTLHLLAAGLSRTSVVQQVQVAVTAGEEIFVEVDGFRHKIAKYDLSVSLI